MRHAHLATELAGETQAEAEVVPGKLEWALRNVEEAFAADDPTQLESNAIHELFTFCRKLVPAQKEIDNEAVLDYLSLDSGSSNTKEESAGEEAMLVDDEGGEEAKCEEMEVAKDKWKMGADSEKAEQLLEEVVVVHQAGSGKDSKGKGCPLPLPAGSSSDDKKVLGKAKGERACSEERGRDEGEEKRQRVDARAG